MVAWVRGGGEVQQTRIIVEKSFVRWRLDDGADYSFLASLIVSVSFKNSKIT